jgi:hypothetical protein
MIFKAYIQQTNKNSTDLEQSSPMEPTMQEAQGTDSRHKQEQEEDEENKMEIAAEGGDQELKVLPENGKEQDKEEAIIETTEKPKISSSPSKTPTKRPSKSGHLQQQRLQRQQKPNEHKGKEGVESEKRKTIPLTSLSKQLDKQNTQIIKVMQILQPIQRQIKSTIERQLELTKQIQSQIKQLQKQVSQVQKEIITITKKNNKNK